MPAKRLHGIAACVFDAYGTLFDPSSVARSAQDLLGDQWAPLAELWRQKQLQYTWLRGLANQHADFWKVTEDALDFALAALAIERPGLKKRLMQSYLTIAAYPEVLEVLSTLKRKGMRCAILSNGTPEMLTAAVHNSGIDTLFDAVLSVEAVGVYKPHPAVYALACKTLNLPPQAICFLSSNGWDAYSAKAFGFQVIWCNRFGQPPERIPAEPDAVISNLSQMLPYVLEDAHQ
jgi:2-haloacid dehalogenase